VTALFPYLMLTVLVITGATLNGSFKGIEFYIGSIDVSKFSEPSVWKDAVRAFALLLTKSGDENFQQVSQGFTSIFLDVSMFWWFVGNYCFIIPLVRLPSNWVFTCGLTKV
jgi:hypothetical protein